MDTIMMLNSGWARMLGPATVLAIALLAGCQAGQSPQPPASVAKEEAEMRNEVPLIRSVNLAQSGEVADVVFELPAAGPNAAPELLLGLRIARRDAESGTVLSDALIKSGLAANIHLLRVEDGKLVAVALTRNSPDLRERLPIAANGAVPGVTSAGVDISLLQAAGLIEPAVFYDVLMFAVADNVRPGRYRLTVELDTAHPQFQAEDIQLLVAYLKKGK
jgi:hypothetical protein